MNKPLFKRTNLTEKIIWVDFEEQTDLGKTFCRFQEHYEGPAHAGKIFSLEEYKEWYIGIKGAWSYYTDWNGYNIPVRVLTPFKNGQFDPMSFEEMDFLLHLQNVPIDGYIIGTFQAKPGALKHELAHGLYATEPEYVTEVLEVLGTERLGSIFEALKSIGYTGVTWVDEVHAYLLECPFVLRSAGADMVSYLGMIESLQTIFNKWTPLEETKNLDPWGNHDARD